jgi:hypothetical protein
LTRYRWSLGFLSRDAGSNFGMPPRAPTPVPEEEQIREVIPARAVLTELARGFLLVRENDRARALRFAVTFLKEQADAPRPAPLAYPSAPWAQRGLGRVSRGAVERPDPRGPP